MILLGFADNSGLRVIGLEFYCFHGIGKAQDRDPPGPVQGAFTMDSYDCYELFIINDLYPISQKVLKKDSIPEFSRVHFRVRSRQLYLCLAD